MAKKSISRIKRGLSKNLPVLHDGQLGYCKDTKELWIGNEGTNDLINGGNVTAEYIKLVSPNGTTWKLSITDNGSIEVSEFREDGDINPPDIEVPDNNIDVSEYEGLIINQVYGGNKLNDGGTSVSHTFVELYNKTDKDISLEGLSVQVAGNGAEWQKAILSGTIPSKHSFLIRGVEHTEIASAFLGIEHYDMETTFKLGKGMKAVLLKYTDTLNVENPFDIDGNGTKAPGYIDMIGVAGNDPGLTIDGCEEEYGTGEFTGNSKQKSVRRINFEDTDNNLQDCEIVDYRVMSLNYNKAPRYLEYGPWDEEDEMPSTGEIIPIDPVNPSSISNTFGNDPKTTRNFTWHTGKDQLGILRLKKASEEEYVEHEATTNINGDTAIHKVKLDNLEVGTEYNYMVGNGSEGDLGWSTMYTFSTANNEDSFSFVQITDTQSLNYYGYEVAANCLSGVLEAHNPNFVFNTGDLVQTGYEEQQWRDLFSTAQESFGNNAIMPVIGNNDVTAIDNFSNFENHFELPGNGPIPTVYSFDYGNTHFVCLNSHTSNFDTQKEWVVNDLSSSNKKWKIVVIHAAPYTSIKESTFDFAKLFEDNEVDLVICGHKHMHMRSYKMKNDVIAEDGIRYIMCNASGSKQGKLDAMQPWMEIRKAPGIPSYNFIEIDSEKIKITSNTINNGMIDTIETIDTIEIIK